MKTPTKTPGDDAFDNYVQTEEVSDRIFMVVYTLETEPLSHDEIRSLLKKEMRSAFHAGFNIGADYVLGTGPYTT